MPTSQPFTFDDAGSFEQNVSEFSTVLGNLDSALGPILTAALPAMADDHQDKGGLFNNLLTALVSEPASSPGTATSTSHPAGATNSSPASPPVVAATVRWFLEGVEIEGFRGINNEGAPLVLKFKPDCVNSISAPNGVGKSSVYDALSFALRGQIPKLERLLQAERPQDYYNNCFHSAGIGTVKLILRPDNGGNAVPITITRAASGSRTVSGPAGIDAQGLLNELNREFVLLDAQSFHSFIDNKALDRGRAFSGLLGLARYSALRQELQAVSNTRAFNTHFDVASHATKKVGAERTINNEKGAIGTAYETLVKESFAEGMEIINAQQRCHAALHGISVLRDHCVDRGFMDVDVDACLEAIKTTEGGPKRERLANIIREEGRWTAADSALPAEADLPVLASLATAREEALKATSGDLLRKLYRLSEQVMVEGTWTSPTLCPTCDLDDGTSVLDKVRAKLDQYDAVEEATAAVSAEWIAKGWGQLAELEKLTIPKDETAQLRVLSKAGEAGTLSTVQAKELSAHVGIMRERATASKVLLATERAALERELPPSLVAVTAAVETARRLQNHWKNLAAAEKEWETEIIRAAHLTRLKTFLDSASATFASAESTMAADRLQKVEPLCQALFKNIMFSPVVPSLQKRLGSEELGIRLAEFWSLRDVSAQALLSESYRNGFAVSVYLAAASLYGGAPRFLILDDVTSSFDAGHQHHLVEVIRTRFARPGQPNGPQVILLSHDTLLEKLFNKYSGSTAWVHQRLEGTARTAVLPQTGAVNKVRDATIDFLNAGRIDDAAPRVRQYLEYTLHEVIDRCRISVPLDLAFGDEKRTPGEYLKAIEAAVDLHKRAGILVLDPLQEQALQLHSATIVGNFLAHWSTGQTQAFSAPALLGVMQAIDGFSNCFKYTAVVGQPMRFYAALNRR